MPDEVDQWEEPSRDDVISRFREQDAANFFSRFPDARRKFFEDSRNIGEAAVLVPLLYDQDHWRLMLTVRSSSLRQQAGDVACPGGKKDDQDGDYVATALREAREEIGLPAHQVEVISCMPPVAGVSDIVVPIVGLIPHDFVPTPDVSEVAEVYTVPMRTFLQSQSLMPSKWVDWHGTPYLYHTFDAGRRLCARHRVAGMTANVAMFAAVMMYQMIPQFKMEVPIDLSDIANVCHDIYFRTRYKSTTVCKL